MPKQRAFIRSANLILQAAALSFFVLSSPSGAQEAASANANLQACRDFAEQTDKTSMFSIGYCAGSLMAVYSLGATILPPFNNCIPAGVTIGQVARVAVAYMEKNPALLHQRLEFMIVRALAEAWPCR